MEILGISTGLLSQGDDLAATLLEHAALKDGDIVVVSSKAVTRTESGSVDLSSLKVREEAHRLAEDCGQDAAFTEFVLQETERLNGTVVSTSPHVILTSLKPSGMKKGRILCPHAGADKSNTEHGTGIGWPIDCAHSAERLRDELSTQSGARIAVIISDSTCTPSRQGVTAFALTVCGMDPCSNYVGTSDLFGRPLSMTQEAIADQLATAANIVMGNASQSTPAAVIRGHGLALSDFCGWVDGIEPEEDLFKVKNDE